MQKGRPDRGGPSLVSDWRGQPWRVPVIAIEPNAPALIVPVSASPSIVASHSSVIGIGTFMFMVQLSLLPSTLPFSTLSAPIAPAFWPVKLSPSLLTVQTDFWSPTGPLVTQS